MNLLTFEQENCKTFIDMDEVVALLVGTNTNNYTVVNLVFKGGSVRELNFIKDVDAKGLCDAVYASKVNQEHKVKDLDERLDSAIPRALLLIRTDNALKELGIVTFRDLFAHRRNDLLRLRGFGKKSLCEIDKLVEEAGLADYWKSKK